VLDAFFGRPQTDSAQDRQALDILSRSLDPAQVESVQGGKKIDRRRCGA
jgi:hypothetical protein